MWWHQNSIPFGKIIKIFAEISQNSFSKTFETLAYEVSVSSLIHTEHLALGNVIDSNSPDMGGLLGGGWLTTTSFHSKNNSSEINRGEVQSIPGGLAVIEAPRARNRPRHRQRVPGNQTSHTQPECRNRQTKIQILYTRTAHTKLTAGWRKVNTHMARSSGKLPAHRSKRGRKGDDDETKDDILLIKYVSLNFFN